MGLWQRLTQVVRAELNPALQQPEDPEVLLMRAVDQLQDQRLQLRLVIAQAIASQKRCQRQHSQAEALAQHWHDQARLALEQGDESTARQALERWQAYRASAQALAQQLQQQQQLIQRLQHTMSQLEQKLEHAQIRKDLLIARARAATTVQQVQQELELFTATADWADLIETAARLEDQATVLTEQEDELEQRWATWEEEWQAEAQPSVPAREGREGKLSS